MNQKNVGTSTTRKFKGEEIEEAGHHMYDVTLSEASDNRDETSRVLLLSQIQRPTTPQEAHLMPIAHRLA
ncbi:hypothetical protein PISMIDRAFT_682653 [Pisolithus microcarpus 441]|uniref:Uncharacterized protein n=1 Tax=Pisolithus microcarpus 441 TaxID=765257 RepID=A0A0C9Z175_9AGAM|nr:hypothetical protein BKA83DRAFT_682653 [Pisolithus microcarpus]KIK20029.1 hypothetical protein PISMIDRAFT_682653 [Pisolithus microcarpus 441]